MWRLSPPLRPGPPSAGTCKGGLRCAVAATRALMRTRMPKSGYLLIGSLGVWGGGELVLAPDSGGAQAGGDGEAELLPSPFPPFTVCVCSL